jgi:histidine triad (HIT) family protein
MDCIFCKIVNKEQEANIIYEDEQVLSFLDIGPVSRGHALVIPKPHSKDILDAEEKDLQQTLIASRRIADAIMKATGAEGFTISTNRGEAAGQTVFHLHFHLIPRYRRDGLVPWPHQKSEPKSRAELAELIKKHL